MPLSAIAASHTKLDGKPPYISAADGGMLSFAGLWDRWKNPETGELVRRVNKTSSGDDDPTIIDRGHRVGAHKAIRGPVNPPLPRTERPYLAPG